MDDTFLVRIEMDVVNSQPCLELRVSCLILMWFLVVYHPTAQYSRRVPL